MQYGGGGFESHPTLPRAGGPCQRGRRRRGRASPSVELVPTLPASRTSSRRPCHYCAIHSGPDRFPADCHGQRSSGLDLRRCPPSQVTNRSDLALQAGGSWRTI
jgi:hypothetical protein